MANEFHKNLILDDIHAVPSRIYADITARDADTDFNTDSTNLYKDVVVLSPLSTYRLMTTAPLFAELTNTTAGNVTTSDTLLATQLLLGNGGMDIVTEPDMTYDGFQLQLATVNITSQLEVGLQTGSTTTLDSDLNLAAGGDFLIDDTEVIITLAGDIVLKNIDVVDNITRDAIEAVIIDLPNLATVGTTSGSILGPSGAWDNDGFNIGPGDKYSINSVIVIDSDPSITLKNIAVLDATTEATIESAIDTLANLISVQGLAVAYADAGEDALWGWDDAGSTYRNLSQSEVVAIVGAVTTSDVLAVNQLLLGNGGVDIVTEPDLVWDGVMFGIGIPNPISRLHVREDNALINQDAGVTIEQQGTGDAVLQFLITGTQRWIVGIDNSDNEKFKIQSVLGFSGAAEFTITTAGLFGLSTTLPDTKLDIDGEGGDALRLRSGNTSGFTRNQIRLSSDDGLDFTHLIKTRHNEFNQPDNAIDIFMWDPDDQDPDDLGNLAVMSIKGDGKIGIGKTSPSGFVDILTTFGDTTPIIQMESGANAGIVRLRTGNRDPNAAVTGAGPDVYYSDRAALSGTYENRAATTDQVWLKRSVWPVDIVELQNSTELDDLAAGGIITISVNTTWHVRAALTTANRIVVNTGITFHITGEFNATASITYTGTGTFISGTPFLLRIWAQTQLISTSTGTLFDITGTGAGGVNLKDSVFIGWDSLGTISNISLFANESNFQSIDTGLILNNNGVIDVKTLIIPGGGTFTGSLFTINTNNPRATHIFSNVSLRLPTATGSLFDLNTRINNNAQLTINGCSVPGGGDLFRQSVLTDATINSVADGSIGTGTITAMADNGSGGTTISSTTTYFEDEEVTISGTTSYNGTFQIFNVVAGVSFDTITTFVADDATGSVDTERLTLSLAGGHGISTGDSIKVIDTNFYNGFMTTLNVVSDDITINGSFISTNTGSIERELSIDQSDPRVSATDNFGFADSHSIACAHVNDNSDAVGSITNNVFTDLVFGTAADALISSSTMERWRLVNELNGTFEYIGEEPFDDAIQFDFTVESAGGTVDFRFKWEHDVGAGFVDLPDNVEALVAVGSDAQSVTKKFPLVVEKGDLIKPQITRNSGSSGITVAYATVFAGG